MSKPIRKRSEVAAEFTWDLTDIFPSDEAWRAEYEALKPYTEAVAAYQGRLGESAEMMLAYFRLDDELNVRVGRLYGYANCKADEDTFTPVVIDKLKTYSIETLEVVYSGDGVENVRDAVLAMRERKPDMILCTGGMSVDPDDNTPGGIRAAGADIVCYGAPVLPGAMFLLGYFDDGTPVMGLPGCVMYAGATVFDLVLPKVAADVPVTRADIAAMGEGGLCLGCKPCRYPVCPFGK